MNAFRTIAVEAAIVFAFTICCALVGNAISSRGLKLKRDYFPAVEPSPGEQRPMHRGAGATRERLASRGLALATHQEVAAWFRDPQAALGLIVFVDARNDALYRAGHVPGAWPFDHYRAEETLPAVLPACLNAMRVVVYCAGGNCEDSEFAALMLRDAGIPAENLFVYVGGMAEWTAHGMPVEAGARGSGQLRPGAP